MAADGTDRVRVARWSILAVFAVFLAARAGKAFFAEAKVPLGWFLAGAIVAVLLTPVIRVLDRHLWRPLAVATVIVMVITFSVVVGYAIFADLSDEIDSLREALPEAAGQLEESDRFGSIAQDIRLSERVEEAVNALDDRVTGEAQSTVTSLTSYVVGGIFMLFLLTWGPRWFEAALGLMPERRAQRVGPAVREAVSRGRAYIGYSLGLAGVVGLVSYGMFRIVDVPAPTPLAVWVAIWTLVPYFGVVVGGLPAVLLAGGLLSASETVTLLVAFFVLQGVAIALQRIVHGRTLYVGPGVILIVGLLGYTVYGVGGALYGAALAVWGLALLDAFGIVPDTDAGSGVTAGDPAVTP